MKNFVLVPVILMSLVVFYGCGSRQKFHDDLSSWQGLSESVLVESWGVPTSFYEGGGRRYLTYRQNNQGVVPGTHSATNPDGTMPMFYSFNCTITMVVENDKIVSWEYEGNNCY